MSHTFQGVDQQWATEVQKSTNLKYVEAEGYFHSQVNITILHESTYKRSCVAIWLRKSDVSALKNRNRAELMLIIVEARLVEFTRQAIIFEQTWLLLADTQIHPRHLLSFPLVTTLW